jgi:hypothetical protein
MPLEAPVITAKLRVDGEEGVALMGRLIARNGPATSMVASGWRTRDTAFTDVVLFGRRRHDSSLALAARCGHDALLRGAAPATEDR